jgi:hypothetical protein
VSTSIFSKCSKFVIKFTFQRLHLYLVITKGFRAEILVLQSWQIIHVLYKKKECKLFNLQQSKERRKLITIISYLLSYNVNNKIQFHVLKLNIQVGILYFRVVFGNHDI